MKSDSTLQSNASLQVLRSYNRAWDQLRPVTLERNVMKNALLDGSGAQHARIAKRNQTRSVGVLHNVALKGDGAQLVPRTVKRARTLRSGSSLRVGVGLRGFLARWAAGPSSTSSSYAQETRHPHELDAGLKSLSTCTRFTCTRRSPYQRQRRSRPCQSSL